MSQRFVLRFRGSGAAPESDVARVRQAPGASIIDQTPHMLLVEGSHDTLSALIEEMTGWSLYEDQALSVPTPPRQSLGRRLT